jgi:hypothetical protein
MHLTTTENEVTARLNKNWENMLKPLMPYNHILKMSDALSDASSSNSLNTSLVQRISGFAEDT